MQRPDPPADPARSRLWDLATLALGVLVVGASLLFAWNDTRVLWDPGRYYLRIPEYYWAFRTGPEALAALGDALLASTGWYEWTLAGLMRAFGRGPYVLPAAGAFWLALLLGCAAWLGRRLGGRAGGLAALAMTAAIPSVTVFARFAWIHVPEAALLMLMLVVLDRDARLERRTTVAALGLLGALTMQIRESGVVWVALFAPVLWFTTRPPKGEPRRWTRLAALGALWAVAVVPTLIRVYPYVRAKVVARARYELATPPLVDQFAEAFSREVMYGMAAGLLLYGLFLFRRWRPVHAVLLLFGAVPVGLFLLFYAGFTNYTPFMPALGVAAALGLVWTHRIFAVVPVGLLFFGLRSWQPFPMPDSGVVLQSDLRQLMRPAPGWGAPDVTQLLDATCTSDDWHSCHVVVTQGLFYPGSEEYGLLELFQLGEDRVELRTVYDVPEEGWEAWGIDALAFFYCGQKDDGYLRRAPDAIEQVVNLASANDLAVAWADRVELECDYHWLTPGGQLAAPELAPRPWHLEQVRTFSLEGAWTVHQEFQQRNPEFVKRPSTAFQYGHDIAVAKQPPGWSALSARQVRVRAARRLREVSTELRAQAEIAAQQGWMGR